MAKAREPDKKENSVNEHLQAREEIFCNYYVKYWNATKAYLKANPGSKYDTARTEAAKWFAKPRIKSRIRELRDQITSEVNLDSKEILQKWIDIAFADITEYITFGSEEVTETDELGNKRTYMRNFTILNDSDKVDGSLITEVKQGRDGITVKLADKIKALEFLTKYMNITNSDELRKLKAQIEKTELEVAAMKEGNTASKVEIKIVDEWSGEDE